MQPAPPVIVERAKLAASCRQILRDVVVDWHGVFNTAYYAPGKAPVTPGETARTTVGDSNEGVQCGYDSRGRFYAKSIPASMVHRWDGNP